jgi:hypothetical protein
MLHLIKSLRAGGKFGVFGLLVWFFLPAMLTAESEIWEQMEMFSEIAPSRQIGQPGHTALVEWWRNRFETLVAKNNPAERQAAADQYLQKKDELEANWIHLLDDSQIEDDHVIRHGVVTEEQGLIVSPKIVRLTLEDPSLFVGILGVCTLIVFFTWIVRRERKMLWGTLGGVGAIAGLLIASALVETDAEKQVSTGTVRTQEDTLLRQEEAGRALVDWDKGATSALKGLWQTGVVRHQTAAFVTGKASLKLLDQAASDVEIYPLAPNLVEPGNLGVNSIEGEMIYIGAGTLEIIEGHNLKDKIVLMDFLSDNNWVVVAQKQARAIVFLEPLDGTEILNYQAASKTTNSLLSVPRFYLTAKGYRSIFGDNAPLTIGGTSTVQLNAEPSRWERAPVDTLWLYIPSKSEVAGEENYSTELVHLQAPLDSMSVVPSISPAADGYANLVLLNRLIERYSKELPEKPILVSLVSDHANALQGEQNFGFFAFATPAALRTELERMSRQIAEFYFTERIFSQPISEPLLEYLRTANENIGGFSYTVKKAAEEYLTSNSNVLREEISMLDFSMKNPDAASAKKLNKSHAEIEAEIVVLRKQAEETIKLLGLFNRFGHKTYFNDLNDAERESLQQLFVRISNHAKEQRESIERDRSEILANLSMRTRLSHRNISTKADKYDFGSVLTTRYPVLNATIALTFDLYFGTNKVGFFHTGYLVTDDRYETFASDRTRFVARFLMREANAEAAATGTVSPLESTVLRAKGLPWSVHLGGIFPVGAFGMQQFGVGALTLTSVQDFRALAYSPHATLDRLNRPLVESQLKFLDGYLQRVIAANEDSRQLRIWSDKGNVPNSFEVTLRQLDRFSVEIPKTLLANGLFTSLPRGVDPLTINRQMLGDVRAYPILKANSQGVVRARGYIYHGSSATAYGYTDDYRMLTAALDLGTSEARFGSQLTATRGAYFTQKNLVTFNARKVDIYGLTDPVSLSPLKAVRIVDGRNNANATTYGVAGISSQMSTKLIPASDNGTASIFIEPGQSFKLRSGNAPLAVGTSADDLSGKGFLPEDGNLYDVDTYSVVDLHRMATYNLDLLSSKGVVNDSATSLNKLAGEELVEMESDAGNSSFSYQTQLEMARSHAFQAFSMSMSTIADLIQAVVILLALIIPFCFFTMKLLCPYNDVNRQLAFFAGTFVLTVAVLYVVQPAFHVGERPEIVILAFLNLGLAFFVGGTIFSRFNSLMNQAIEEINMSDSVDAPQGRLAGVAFGVGVNNMKRRRIRTSLTCATVVLVTFTALSVISVDQSAEALRQRISPETPYTGIVFTGPGMSPLDQTRVDRIRDYFGTRASSVIRTWTSRKGKEGEYLPYFISPVVKDPSKRNEDLEVRVLLGLEVNENGFLANFTSDDAMLKGSRWFSDNNASELILSYSAIRLMGYEPEEMLGQEMVVGGMRLRLVGIIYDEFLESLRDLRNIPLVPMISAASQDAGANASESGDISSQPGISPAKANTIALLPLGIARSSGTSEIRILSVKYNTDEEGGIDSASARVWQDANQLIGFQSIRLGVSFEGKVDRGSDRSPIDAGQYFLAPSSNSQIGGITKVAIPMILAATIILNTMLGSVMERKKEVSIYNAIGLNPTHVMVFFLAESLVFGLVGSVAGYLIGQVLSVGLAQILDINLNFSSMAVMVVIFLTIATVLLSTLYPAMMAARAAVPSGQRKWSLPKPEGDEIHLEFPFSYDKHRVLGVCAYLHEYMQQNSEASTGKFLAKYLQHGRVPAVSDSEGVDGESLVMLYQISPPPFDLGVNQTMEVYAYYNSRVKAYMLSVHLTRVSGDVSSWVTVNQPFLESLRKKLLGWRSQKASLQQEFYEKGRILFEGSPTLPTKAN